MLPGIGIGVLVPGQPSHDVAALLDGFVEQFGRAGIAQDSLLGKGHDLDLAETAEALAGEEQALSGAQAADRAHVGEEPEERGSVLDTRLEDPAGAPRHLLGVVLALEVVGDLDRFGERSRHVRTHSLAEQGLVGVEMEIHEAGRHETASGVDLPGCRGG